MFPISYIFHIRVVLSLFHFISIHLFIIYIVESNSYALTFFIFKTMFIYHQCLSCVCVCTLIKLLWNPEFGIFGLEFFFKKRKNTIHEYHEGFLVFLLLFLASINSVGIFVTRTLGLIEYFINLHNFMYPVIPITILFRNSPLAFFFIFFIIHASY